LTEYEKQKKEEDTKIPVANTIPKNNHMSNQKYPKFQSDQKLSHETRSDLKARL
jgi:hypothetical protein